MQVVPLAILKIFLVVRFWIMHKCKRNRITFLETTETLDLPFLIETGWDTRKHVTVPGGTQVQSWILNKLHDFFEPVFSYLQNRGLITAVEDCCGIKRDGIKVWCMDTQMPKNYLRCLYSTRPIFPIFQIIEKEKMKAGLVRLRTICLPY